MLRKVYLEGEIADKFGSEFEMDVSSFGEALQCFELNFQEFREYMLSCHERGIGFVCSVADKPLDYEDQLLLEYPQGSLTIQALPLGSKGGLGKLFLAIALIVVTAGAGAVIAAGSTAALGGGFGALAAGLQFAAGTILGKIAIGLAINLALTGLQEMMAPDPSVDVQQDPDAYLFQGASQNLIEGDPVPILYGQLRVPGRPISFEIKNAARSFVDYDQPLLDSPSQGPQNNGPDNDHGSKRDGR